MEINDMHTEFLNDTLSEVIADLLDLGVDSEDILDNVRMALYEDEAEAE